MKFESVELNNLWKPSEQEANFGSVLIIGGSSLFHGAPVLSLTAATRQVSMVFFASPEPGMKQLAVELKSRLSAFIWIPWDQVDAYAEKADAILIGPGFMRYRNENDPGHETDHAGVYSRTVTKRLLEAFSTKQWVIDAGSLQVMDPEWIPQGAILTPNKQEFSMLFGEEFSAGAVTAMAGKYHCVIIGKNPEITYVSDGEEVYEVHGGNLGMEKGGVGDTLAGVVVGLAAHNPPLLAAAAGSFLVKSAADTLFERVGFDYNADDLAGAVFETKKQLSHF